MSFKDKFQKQFQKKQNFLCIGLDTDIQKMPEKMKKEKNPILTFNQWIIEQTEKYSVAYKPNMAFYEAYGLKGMEALYRTIEILHQLEIPVVLDAKRGDIGNTAEYYAKAVFEDLGADAVTLAPYMGFDSIEPFIRYQNKVSFVLGLTSNPSASDFELLETKDGKKIYEKVFEKVKEWNQKNKNLGLVIGATKKEELEKMKSSFKDLSLLVPGVGTQGGDLAEVVKNLYQDNILLINISRAVIYDSDPEKKAKEYHERMRKLLEKN
ncbi:MAG TPA: orotidine-5'-phosphate decarboxylase [Spirochaetia bacterium]|nr:MAG: orotidine 5'-phosphate decarboxylase [Spirochaetes bacterium GWB1_36_13]HCL57427.1 orotidine-5'-phosphate decarboxylase [Spirochaetia bacterium]